MPSISDDHHATREVTTDNLLQGYPEKLIINRPDLKSQTLIFGEEILTIIFWGFWFYLWLPLISLIAWLLGFRFFHTHMVELGGLEGFMNQIDTFTIGIVLASGILATWSFYNLRRYGSYNRRNKILSTDLKKLRDDFSVTSQDFDTIQQAKRISLSFDEQNEINAIESVNP